MRQNIRVANSEDDPDWSRELVKRIGRAMKEARGGKSAAWLSERTAELGHRVSPTVIAKLDSGHRGSVLSVAELIVIAAALNTAPVNLVYPGPYDEAVEVLPGRDVFGFEAAQWFSGIEAIESIVGLQLEDLQHEGRPRYSGADWNAWDRNTELLQQWRMLARLREIRAGLLESGSKVALEQLSAVNEQIQMAEQEIADRYRDA